MSGVKYFKKFSLMVYPRVLEGLWLRCKKFWLSQLGSGITNDIKDFWSYMYFFDVISYQDPTGLAKNFCI